MNNRFNPNGIPDYLKARQQWVVWGKRSTQGIDALQKDGRLNKIPFNSRTGKNAASNKPNTWGTFEDAVITYQSGWYNGVGFMFAKGDRLVGIDLDHCLSSTNTPNPQTQDILSHFENTFTEISPSGDGLHILCFGLALHCGKGQRNKWIEIYGKDIHGKRSNRYFCMTGNQFGKSLEITDGQAALAWLHNTFKAQTVSPTNANQGTTGSHLEKYVRTAFEDEISKVRNAVLGSRNDQLFKSAAALKELCNSDWASPYISEHEIEAALLTATGLDEKEARTTIGSAFKSAHGTREKPANKTFGTPSTPFGTLSTPFGTFWHSPNFFETPLFSPPDDPSGPFGTDEWRMPIPIIENDTSLSEITPDMLPQNISEWIIDIAERMQIYPTFPSVGLISFASSIIARRVAIYPKKFDTEWQVIPNVWGGIVGQPGAQKTPSLNPVFAPIRKYDGMLRKEYDNALKKWQDVEKEERDEKPIRRVLFTNDATVEAIHALHKNNPQGLLLFRDELSGFIESMDKPGREGERQFYLEAWGGDGVYSSDRISRDNTYVDGLCLTVFGGIQPRVLEKYISSALSGKGDDGFIQRFQMLVKSVPKSDYVLTDKEPNAKARLLFDETMNRLLALPIHGSPVFVRFDGEAQAIFNEWFERLEKRLRSGTLSPVFASHLSKYRSLFPSLALIFEVLDNPSFCVEKIMRGDLLPNVSAQSANLALLWVNFLEIHARALLLDSPGESSKAALLADKILQRFKNGDKLKDGMSLRDFKRTFKAKSENDTLDNALELLSEFGWIRILKVKTSGRAKSVIHVNPVLFDDEEKKWDVGVPKVPKGSSSGENSGVEGENGRVPKGSENVPKGCGKKPENEVKPIDNIN